MTVNEVLETVDLLVPNALSPDKKIRFINQIRRQLFRDYPLPEAFYLFQTEIGKTLYDLPDDCPEDRIQKVVVDGCNYDYQPITDDEGSYRFWTMVSGMLMIHPEPKKVMDGMVYYKQRPTDLTTEDMDNDVGFHQDYQNLMVYGCCELVALSNPETAQLANTYAGKFSDLATKADRDITKYKPKKVRTVRSWV